MSYSRNVWQQIKNITKKELCRALEKDGWLMDETRGAVRVYRTQKGDRVTIHYHAKDTFGEKLLKKLLSDIGWSEEDLKRLKLIKGH